LQKIIGVTEFQRGFRAVFEEVAHKRVPCILTRGNRPEAVLVPYEDFARFQELQEKAILARFDRLRERMVARHARLDEDQLAADIAAARNEPSA
jgi:prevent-host-death family protein